MRSRVTWSTHQDGHKPILDTCLDTELSFHLSSEHAVPVWVWSTMLSPSYSPITFLVKTKRRSIPGVFVHRDVMLAPDYSGKLRRSLGSQWSVHRELIVSPIPRIREVRERRLCSRVYVSSVSASDYCRSPSDQGMCSVGTRYWRSSCANIPQTISTARSTFMKPVRPYIPLNMYGNNLLSSEGHEWTRHRKVAAPAFRLAEKSIPPS